MLLRVTACPPGFSLAPGIGYLPSACHCSCGALQLWCNVPSVADSFVQEAELPATGHSERAAVGISGPWPVQAATEGAFDLAPLQTDAGLLRIAIVLAELCHFAVRGARPRKKAEVYRARCGGSPPGPCSGCRALRLCWPGRARAADLCF